MMTNSPASQRNFLKRAAIATPILVGGLPAEPQAKPAGVLAMACMQTGTRRNTGSPRGDCRWEAAGSSPVAPARIPSDSITKGVGGLGTC